MKKLLLLFFFIFFHITYSILILPQGSANVIGFVCPPPYNIYPITTCTNSIQQGLSYAFTHSDPFVYTLGSSYTISDTNVTTTTEFLLIESSLTLAPYAPYNIANFTTVTFQTSSSIHFGLSIDADHVQITRMSFIANFALTALIQIEYNLSPTKRAIFHNSYDLFNKSLINWEFLHSYIPQNHHYFSQRDSFEDSFQTAETTCLDCFCGCGLVPVPVDIRTGITIVNNTFTGITGPLLYINGNFGINQTLIQYNSFLSSTPGIVDIYINSTFVDDTDLTLNYYGNCVFPNVIITFCQDDNIYLPYFTDSRFLYPGPLAIEYSSSNFTYYSNLLSAYSAGVSASLTNITVYIRGMLPVLSQVIANGGRLYITSFSEQSCCAYLSIAPSLNPAFISVFPNVYFRNIRIIMGTGSGLLLTRSPFTPLSLSLFNASSHSNAISASSLLPGGSLAALLQSITFLTTPPNPMTFDKTIFHNVNMKSVTGPYVYAILSFNINQNNLYNNFVVENSMIEDAEIGIASNQVFFTLINNYFDCTQNAIAIQSTTSTINFNKFVTNQATFALVLLGNPNTITFTNNIIISSVGSIIPTFPALTNYTSGYNFVLPNNSLYYQEANGITGATNILLGPGSPNSLDLFFLPFQNYTANCVYDIKAFYMPPTDWNPIYFGTSSIFVYGGNLDNLTVAFAREDQGDFNGRNCNYFTLYSLFGENGNVEMDSTFSLNDPTLLTPDSFTCTGTMLTYDSVFNNFNENYYLHYVPPSTTGTTSITTGPTTTTTGTSTTSSTTSHITTSNITTSTSSSSTTLGPSTNSLPIPVGVIIAMIIFGLILGVLLVVLCYFCDNDTRRKRKRIHRNNPFIQESSRTILAQGRMIEEDQMPLLNMKSRRKR